MHRALYQEQSLLFDVISTLIYGAVIAFVLNVPMKKIEQYLVKMKVKAELRRPIAMVLVFLALILIVIGLLVLVLPTLAQTISQLGTVLSTVLTQLGKLLDGSEFVTKDMLSTIVSGIQGQSSSISQALIGFLSGLTSNIGNIFSSLMNAFLIIVFTFLFLSSKEHLAAMTSRLLKVLLSEKVVTKLAYIGQIGLETYDQFLMSQLIEAVIIGVMVAVGYSLFGLPYALWGNDRYLCRSAVFHSLCWSYDCLCARSDFYLYSQSKSSFTVYPSLSNYTAD